MRYRTFGRLGWRVSEIGLGAARLFSTQDRDNALDESAEIVRRALGLGINYLDTARYYRRSEEILGHALQGVTSPYYLATKAGCEPADFDYSCDAVLRSFETSPRVLRRERVDLLQIHEANMATREQIMRPGGALEALHRLKKEGLVTGVGITGRNPEFLGKLADTGEFDSVLTYNDQDLTTRLAREALIPTALRRGMAVVLGSPLRGGLLGPRCLDVIKHHPEPVAQKARQLLATFGDPSPLHHLAIRYLLSDPDVSVVLSGAASVHDICDAVKGAEAGPLSEDALAAIRRIQAG
jgi:aryl-alcohol dehydrogenase-like predicted oxidoreductase